MKKKTKEKEVKIGKVLIELMNKHHYSLKELSLLSGVPQSTISHLRANRNPRDISTVNALADVFDVSLHEMLYGEADVRSSLEITKKIETELFNGIFELSLKRVDKKLQENIYEYFFDFSNCFGLNCLWCK